MEDKKVKDLLIPLANYPHLPYWATLQDALVQLISASEPGMDTILVFNEAYRLVGILTQVDILRAIEPKLSQHPDQGVTVSLDPLLLWDSLLSTGTKERLQQPIKACMSPAKVLVKGDDSILKASYLMLNEKQEMLPVQEKEKIIGVVRISDVFRAIISSLLA